VLADAGVASRRAADRLISEGHVKVNGTVVDELGTKVNPYDKIMVDDKLIGEPERHIYLLLNKPKDTITTTSDERGRKTVLDLVHSEERIYPVGRLDRNTTGALLLTNDGELANRLMHPSYGIERFYNVVLDKPLELKDARAIAAGDIDIGDGDVTGQTEVVVEDKDRTHVQIMLREGKNREVRRLFEYFGYDVVRLDRKMYAGLSTRGLARGDSRRLDRRELSALRRLVGLE
jgi:23S rRNA pseudouridine2605 synthase